MTQNLYYSLKLRRDSCCHNLNGYPTGDWFLNLQILTSGGFRGAITRSTT